ncbi:hypothetical protein FEM41_18360 [Jejubacter calystegiae]|uniref:Uncharacterized protein n=1 Tax=Jejubacter calystegiae TaxID=2579935 RepID=A0A4P8YP14_9ENTR|nr:hypothetical protein [Jejubacter calystegiae]QCT21474.1 hypothetical protein FEM41_18360 [Jejubacter calystegiae]
MATRRVPAGFRILIAVGLFILTFLLVRPSDPATHGQIAFWKKVAGFFGDRDVEGFVGLALLAICTMVTVIGYQVIVRLAEKKLNRTN